MNFINIFRDMFGFNNSTIDNIEQQSLIEIPQTSVNLEQECLDFDGSDILDLDKFYEDIQELDTNILENKTEEIEVNLHTESSSPKNLDVFNSTSDVIVISFDEESNVKDLSSLEDDIPISVLIKHENDNTNSIMKLGFQNSNSVKLVNIVPCGKVNLENTTDDLLISDNDFKMINSSIDEDEIEANDDDTGYHSSDFEFISESEAKTAGIIKNKKQKATHKPFLNKNTNDMTGVDNLYSNDYRKNHVIPSGDSYIKLFQGQYAPMNSGFMENKAFHVSKMSIDFEGVGFNMRMHCKETDNAEYFDEANNVAQMIPRLYPNENKRKRRRYQKNTD